MLTCSGWGSCTQDVRDELVSANAYVATNTGADRTRSGVAAAPVVRQLQRQAAGLARALVLLANEAESEAVRGVLLQVRAVGDSRREFASSLRYAKQKP